MFKKLMLAVAILMGATTSAFCALGNPTVSVLDNLGLFSLPSAPTKLYTYGTVSEATTVVQTGGWIDMAGSSGFTAEIIMGLGGGVTAATGYEGSYQIQVSNDQIHVYTVWQDNNPSFVQAYNYAYTNKTGWRYVRPVATPTTGNTGTLNIQIKAFGNEIGRNLGAEGVADEGPVNVFTEPASVFTAAVTFTDFKIPAGYTGVEFWINCTALSGTSFTPTFYKKDPVSGNYITIGTGVAVTGTGETVVKIGRGLTATSGVFSDSINENMAIAIPVTVFTSASVAITAVPTR